MSEQPLNEQQKDQLLEKIVDHFTARVRNGKAPDIEKYQAKYPQLKDEIQELLSSVAMIEELKQQNSSQPASLNSTMNEVTKLEKIGDYRIVRELGRGGMGIVFEAVHESLGRQVAVKVLPGRNLGDEKTRERFLREAQAAATLHHTNIVNVFGVGVEQDHHYYVMEYVEGDSLDRILKTMREEPTVVTVRKPTEAIDQTLQDTPGGVDFAATTPELSQAQRTITINLGMKGDDGGSSQEFTMSSDALRSAKIKRTALPARQDRFRWAANMCSQIADALAYAHEQKMLHRDLKPGNLMLDHDGTVWLTDFGLVKNLTNQTLTRTGDIIGTPQYMAPESFEGRYDERSETYCLGLTLYELATLSPAFESASTAELIRAVTSSTPMSPNKRDPKIPRDLNTIILKAINREPEARYQTAAELRDDLRAFMEDRSIQARKSSPVEQAWRWGRRNPTLAVLSLTSIFLLAATAATASWGYYKSQAQSKKLAKLLEEAEDNRKVMQAQNQKLDQLVEEGKANELILEWEISQKEKQTEKAEANIAITINAFNKMFDNILQRGAGGEIDLDVDGLQELSGIESVLTPTDAEALGKLVEIYQEVVSQTSDEEVAQVNSAQAFRKVGNAYHLVGNFKKAIESYRKAVDQYAALLADSPDNGQLALAQARSQKEFGTALRSIFQIDDALAQFKGAATLLRDHSQSQDPELQLELARVFNTMAYAGPRKFTPSERIERLPRWQQHEENTLLKRKEFVNKAITILDRLANNDNENADVILARGKSYRTLAEIQFSQGNQEAGAQTLKLAFEQLETLNTNYPDQSLYKYILALAYKTAAGFQNRVRTDELLKSIEITESLIDMFPNNTRYQQLEFVTQIDLADAYLQERNQEQARKYARLAVVNGLQIMRGFDNRDQMRLMFRHIQKLGQVLRQVDPQQAEELRRQLMPERRPRGSSPGRRFPPGR